MRVSFFRVGQRPHYYLCVPLHHHIPSFRSPAWPCSHLSLRQVLQPLISRYAGVTALQSCARPSLASNSAYYLVSTRPLVPVPGLNRLWFPPTACAIPICLDCSVTAGSQSSVAIGAALDLVSSASSLCLVLGDTYMQLPVCFFFRPPADSRPSHALIIYAPRTQGTVSPYQPRRIFVTLESIFRNPTSQTIDSPC